MSIAAAPTEAAVAGARRRVELSRVARELWRAAWTHRQRAFAALALLLLAKGAGVAVPLLLKAIIDAFSRPETVSAAAPEHPAVVMVLPPLLLVGYALMRFAGTLFSELRDMVFSLVTQRTVAAYAERSFGHLLAMSPRFHIARSTGELIRDVERGTGGVGFLLGVGLFTVLPTLIEFGAVLLVMSSFYSAWFTAIIVLTFCAYAVLTIMLTRARGLRQRRVNELDSRASGRLVDGLLNYETVKSHAREDYERARYGEICEAGVQSGVANQRMLSALHIGQSAIIAAGVAAVMLLAGAQTVSGDMTVGDLVLVNAYVIQICLPLNALGFVFREASDALIDVERLFELLDQAPEQRHPPGSTPLSVQGGEVAFEHVDFSYEKGRPVLQDVSLTIPPGRTVAVVGSSGSGKSTLARLLMRLYAPDAGRITIDGQDLAHATLDSVRRAVGVVPQDTVLFNDTIAYNIGYAREGATQDEIVEAARAAQVHEFVLALPQQYATVAGERGLKLSGGEKQRIAISRAFLKNPPVMIFDEATSALDTRAERAIQGELDRIAKGRTTLVIAHRLTTIVNADEIVVMDRGRIVERGRHEALLERDGLYAQLWNLQAQQDRFERLERRMARRAVSLVPLLAGVVEGLHDSAVDTHGLRLHADIALHDAVVTCDPVTLAPVLRELLLSALQSTSPGASVELRLARQQEQARITITAAPAQGTTAINEGHGVAIDPLPLRSAIERQGGHLTTWPPDGEQGLRYVIDLPPRVVSPPAPAEGPADPAAGLPAEGVDTRPLDDLRVLVVDDHADARETLDLLLAVHGARPIAFDSGHAALDWLAQQPTGAWPDVMLCDIRLRGEDGYEVMRRVRTLEQGAHRPAMPAAALTGLAEQGHRVRALAAGFQMHLVKPVEPGLLVATLQTLTGRPAAADPSVPSSHRTPP